MHHHRRHHRLPTHPPTKAEQINNSVRPNGTWKSLCSTSGLRGLGLRCIGCCPPHAPPDFSIASVECFQAPERWKSLCSTLSSRWFYLRYLHVLGFNIKVGGEGGQANIKPNLHVIHTAKWSINPSTICSPGWLRARKNFVRLCV